MTTDTAPPPFEELARERLYGSVEYGTWLSDHVGLAEPIPDSHLEAAAMEAYTAFTEALDTWVETLIAGRPYEMPLVEWEHRDLDKRPQQAAEMRAEMMPDLPHRRML